MIDIILNPQLFVLSENHFKLFCPLKYGKYGTKQFSIVSEFSIFLVTLQNQYLLKYCHYQKCVTSLLIIINGHNINVIIRLYHLFLQYQRICPQRPLKFLILVLKSKVPSHKIFINFPRTYEKLNFKVSNLIEQRLEMLNTDSRHPVT